MKTEIQTQFEQALKERCGVRPSNTVLVALSGGADSVALLHLLLQNNIKCTAAHCNFNLRGAESDADEQFVQLLCAQLNVPLKTISFKTIENAKSNKISIEMAARKLRYDWFNQLTKELKLDLIATGHHGDDAMETFFLNLTRGTGIKGLTGIAWRSENIIRPLLFASAKQIREYCKNEKLHFKVDSTNHENIFYRNKIRNQIVPLFKEMNPAFFATMQNNMEYLNESWLIVHDELKNIEKEWITQQDGSLKISISTVQKYSHRKILIFELLQPYGFSGQQVLQLMNTLNKQSGKQFISPSHRVVVDRLHLILTPISEQDKNQYLLKDDDVIIKEPIDLKIKKYPRTAQFQFSKNQNIVHLDADLLNFPLRIRHPQKGDKFQPLGMINFKKLSDFFIDEKLSLIEKEQTWLLINGQDVVWVIGQRIDNRYKITPQTKNILEITLL